LDAVIGGSILVFLYAYNNIAFARMHFPPAATRLQGATWLRLPKEQTAQYEAIATSVGKNCSTLFTMPGMASFNLWSGVPTPNGWNMTNWMRGISPERQAEILSIIQADPQACAIVNWANVRFWERSDAGYANAGTLPLAHYVMTDMPEITKVGQYEIHVHPRRSSPWLQ
jgi:hypothetical protein